MKSNIKKFLIGRTTLCAFAILLGLAHLTAQDIRTERVSFEKGASSANIEGQITGRETVDYLLNVRSGQYMNISLATDNTANYFNILEPGEEYVAVFNSSLATNQYEGKTTKSGDYRIRVYLFRAAANNGEEANYRLEMIVSGTPEADLPGDALVAGTDYHATGKVPCSAGSGQPTGYCDFGVTREGNGSGMVTVTKPDGRKRVIFFEDGKATGYDMSQADPGEFRATKEADIYIIHIGEERYEIPEAVIYGG
jgi:hypothetical protein